MSTNREEVQEIIEELRQMIAEKFGVTVVEDVAGEHGPLGAQYLTIRWNKGEDLVQVHTQIISVSAR